MVVSMNRLVLTLACVIACFGVSAVGCSGESTTVVVPDNTQEPTVSGGAMSEEDYAIEMEKSAKGL